MAVVQGEREFVVSALLEPPSAMFGVKFAGVHYGTEVFALGGTIIEQQLRSAVGSSFWLKPEVTEQAATVKEPGSDRCPVCRTSSPSATCNVEAEEH